MRIPLIACQWIRYCQKHLYSMKMNPSPPSFSSLNESLQKVPVSAVSHENKHKHRRSKKKNKTPSQSNLPMDTQMDIETSHISTTDPLVRNSTAKKTMTRRKKQPSMTVCPTLAASPCNSAHAHATPVTMLASSLPSQPGPLSTLLTSYTMQELAQAHLLLKPVRLFPSVYVVRTAYHSDLACCLLLEDMNKTTRGLTACSSTDTFHHTAYSISFDTETTVTRKTHPGAPSVIQLATPNLCILFQVYAFIRWNEQSSPLLPINFPMRLKAILESPHLVKYGLGAWMDAQALQSSYGIQPRSILELQQLNDGLGLPKSLAKYTALYSTSSVYQSKTLMRKHVWRDHLKRYWERSELNMEEIDYASKDVFAVISAFRNFVKAEQSDIFSIQKEIDALKEANERARLEALQQEALNK